MASACEARLLERLDGERRLTNVLHVAELLQNAAVESHRGPLALIEWLHRVRRDALSRGGMAADAEQIRLESDAKRVKITTIHQAKGLEYPVVYCPFLWGNLFEKRRGRAGSLPRSGARVERRARPRLGALAGAQDARRRRGARREPEAPLRGRHARQASLHDRLGCVRRRPRHPRSAICSIGRPIWSRPASLARDHRRGRARARLRSKRYATTSSGSCGRRTVRSKSPTCRRPRVLRTGRGRRRSARSRRDDEASAAGDDVARVELHGARLGRRQRERARQRGHRSRRDRRRADRRGCRSAARRRSPDRAP